MAVSIITSPVTPDPVSVSYPFQFEVQTTVLPDVNVEQHRFYFDLVVDSVPLLRKYAVATEGSLATVDLSRVVRQVIELSAVAENGFDLPTNVGGAVFLSKQYRVVVEVQTGEQYWDGSNLVTNVGPLWSGNAYRGWTGETDREFQYANYYDEFSIGNLLPYSGMFRGPVVALPTDGVGWRDISTYPLVQLRYAINGGAQVSFGGSYQRSNDLVIYAPMFQAGVTNTSTFRSLAWYVYVNNGGGTDPQLQNAYYQERTIPYGCNTEEEEIRIMFRDRYNGWSVMSFPRYNRVTKVRTSDEFRGVGEELINDQYMGDDRSKIELFDVKSSDTIRINTDWLPEHTNIAIKDLTDSPIVFQVVDSGRLRQAVVRDSAVLYKTLRNNMVKIQYSFTLEYSARNFQP